VRTSASAQRGAALFVSMIMLVLITLFVLASINSSTVNLRITANSQAKAEAVASAQAAIEQVLSTDFPSNPQPATISVDIKNSTTANYSVAVATPECKNTAAIKLVDLDIGKDDDVACFVSAAATNPGLAPSPSSGNSVCAYAQWDLNATVTDTARSATAVTVHQGVGQRVSIGSSC